MGILDPKGQAVLERKELVRPGPISRVESSGS